MSATRAEYKLLADGHVQVINRCKVRGGELIEAIGAARQVRAATSPKREYLWVLSRTARVEPAAYEALLGRLAQKGFDLHKLELTQQE